MNTKQITSLFLVVFILSILIGSSKADLHCTDPQKGFYMSYNALSKRDTMTDLFILINSKMSKYNYTYDDGKGSKYTISNMLPQLYYNQHHQKQIYVDPQNINVTLGDVQMAFRLDYNISSTSGSNQSGWARGRVLLDQTSYFIKRLLIKDGFLEWDPTEANNLTITYPITIEHSQPVLQYDHKSTIQLILNDHISGRKLKTQIIEAFNQLYRVNLKEHLNKQDIIGNMKITYNYKNIRVDFLNAVKNYTLSNNQIKGLQAFFFFEAQNKTFNCTGDQITFNQADYGGLQEIYSISSFREALKSALQQGLMDVKLDKKWQVPTFQFYMGDLANSVQYAQNFPADDPFDVSCRWSGNRSDVDLRTYDTHDLFANISVVCTLEYKGKQILQIRTQISYVVRVYGQDDSLTFYITGANIFGPQYKSLDPNYKVTNTEFARYSVARVVEGLSKTTTFGTGWKTAKRRFPSTHINGDYLIVFDPSEL